MILEVAPFATKVALCCNNNSLIKNNLLSNTYGIMSKPSVAELHQQPTPNPANISALISIK